MAIDDFGNRLLRAFPIWKRFELDALKIDKSFVGCHRKPGIVTSSVIVRVIEMGKIHLESGDYCRGRLSVIIRRTGS